MWNNTRRGNVLAFALYWGAFLLLTCCDIATDPGRTPEASRFVAPDGLSRLVLKGDRWDLRTAAGPRLPEIAPNWEGGTHLAGVMLGRYEDQIAGASGVVLRVEYVGQILQDGNERPRGLEFLAGGRWASGSAMLPLTDTTAGPVNGWEFRREYSDPNPPRIE